MHPDDIPDSEWKKLKEEIGTYPSFATVKKFIYEVSPFTVNEGNKDQYLNKCIEDLYLQIEAKIQNKVDTIAAIKTNVDKLVEEGEEDEDMEPVIELDDNGKPIKPKKPTKKKMCPKFMKDGKCAHIKDKEKPCKFAHNPLELNLIPNSIKVKNLSSVMEA
jgi:hypothetical protein